MKAHRLSRITGAVVLALGLSTSAMADDTSSSSNTLTMLDALSDNQSDFPVR